MAHPLEPYQYVNLPTQTSLRIMELLPGQEGDPVSCLLHVVDWSNYPEYEAISYAWGDPSDKAEVTCHGKRLHVTKNLQRGLTHLRLQDRPRFLWADAICIYQSNILERGHQVSQMQEIYQKAKTIHIWLGPDTQDHQAKVAINSILTISDFLCQKLGISVSDLSSMNDVYQEVVFKNRDYLPLPNECEFSSDAMWKSLVWFYPHSYFTRVWVIQEINAKKPRLLHCGREEIE